MTEFYFLRHGIAAPKDDPSFPDDSERPLINDGIKKTRAAARGLAALDIEFDRLFTSPFRRARETAEIVGKMLGIKVEELPELAANRSVSELLGALEAIKDEHILLVGHQPLLGECISFLLSKSKSLSIDLKKSGLCVVAVGNPPVPSGGTLKWMMTPRQLRKLG